MDPHRPNQPNSFVANLAALEIPNGLPNIPALSVGIPSNQGLPGIQFVLPAIPSTIPDDMTDAAREEVYDTVVSMSLSMAQKAAIDARSVQSHVKLLRLMNNFSRMENAAAVAANNDVVPSALMCSSTSSAQLQLEAPKQEAIVPATRPLGQKVEDTAHAPVLPKPIDDSRDSGSSGVANNAGIISNTTNDAPNRGLPDDSSELSAAITTASIPPKPLEDVTIVPTDSCNMESVQSADALEKKDEIKSVKSESVDVNGSSNVTDHCEVSMEQDEVVDAPIDLNESKTLPVELTESALVSSPKKDRTVLSSTPIEDEAVKTIDISDKNDSVKMQDTISSDKSNVFNHDETLPMEQSHDDDVPIKLDSIETPSDETQDGSVEIEKNSGSVETENIVSRDPLKDTNTSSTENTEEFPKEKSQDYEASNTVKSDSISMEVLENETVKTSEPMEKLGSGQTEAIISSDASDDSDDKDEKESKKDDDSSESNSTKVLSQKNADDVSNSPDTDDLFSQKPIGYEDVDAEETVQDVDATHWENTEKLPEEQAPDDDASNPVESINDGVTSLPSELHEDETVEATQPLEEVETNETKNHVFTDSSNDTDHENLLEDQSPEDDDSNFMRSDNVNVAVPLSHTSNHDETPLLSDLVEEIEAAIYTEKRDEPPNQTVEEDLAMSDDEFDDDSTKLVSINIPQEGDTSNTDRVLLTSSQIKKEIMEDIEIEKNPGNVEPELIDLCMDPHRPNQPNPLVANLAALGIPNGLPYNPALFVGIPSNSTAAQSSYADRPFHQTSNMHFSWKQHAVLSAIHEVNGNIAAQSSSAFRPLYQTSNMQFTWNQHAVLSAIHGANILMNAVISQHIVNCPTSSVNCNRPTSSVNSFKHPADSVRVLPTTAARRKKERAVIPPIEQWTGPIIEQYSSDEEVELMYPNGPAGASSFAAPIRPTSAPMPTVPSNEKRVIDVIFLDDEVPENTHEQPSSSSKRSRSRRAAVKSGTDEGVGEKTPLKRTRPGRARLESGSDEEEDKTSLVKRLRLRRTLANSSTNDSPPGPSTRMRSRCPRLKSVPLDSE